MKCGHMFSGAAVIPACFICSFSEELFLIIFCAYPTDLYILPFYLKNKLTFFLIFAYLDAFILFIQTYFLSLNFFIKPQIQPIPSSSLHPILTILFTFIDSIKDKFD